MAKIVSSGSLNAKQVLALDALMKTPSIEEAALVSKVGTRTLYRWLKEPVFKSAFLESRRELMGVTIAKVQQATGEAIQTLKAVMADSAEPASARVTAARTVLELALRGLETLDLEARISALEAVRPHTNGRDWRVS
jgi:hypothetical protein